MRIVSTLVPSLALALLLAAPSRGVGQTLEAADSALAACMRAAESGDRRATRAAADRAEGIFRRLQEAQPRSAGPRVGRARVISQCRIPTANMLSAGRLIGESNRLLEEALELDPTHWTARFTLAMNHYHTPAFLGRTEDAIRQLEILLSQQGERADGPQMAMPYAYLGDLYRRSGRGEEALRLWQRGARLFPRNAALRSRLEKAAGEAAPKGDAAQEPGSAAGEPAPDGSVYQVQGVTVRARRLAPQTTVGGTSLNRLEVITAPGGTADLLQGLRMQEGVTQATDGSDLFVRGGEPAEAPVWVDGGRILYPGTFENLHGGLFGVLNPAVLREALFFSGGFSARYGNALSGALDVHTEGRPAQLRTSGGLSLAGASASGFVPLGGHLGAWGAGKLTDATLLTWMQGVRDDFSEAPRALEATFGVVGTPSRNLELKATGVVQGDGATRSIDAYGHQGDFRSRGGTRVGVLSARASRADGAVGRVALSASERSSAFRFGVLDQESTDRTVSVSVSSGVPVGREATLRGGAEAAWYHASREGWLPSTGSVAPDAPRSWSDDASETRHIGGYAEVEAAPLPGVSVVAGVRGDLLPGEEEATLDPRLAVAYRAGGWTVRAGGGVFQQGRWRVGYRVPDAGTPGGIPRRARHLALGVEREGAMPLRVEAYLKEYDRYVEEGLGPQVEAGRVIGVDARYRWSAGESLSGWLVYSYLRGRVRLEDGVTVPSRVDVTHGVTAVGKWAFGEAWEMGGTARLATGRPYTPVLGASFSPNAAPEPIFAPVHSDRLPAYARLDARLLRLGSLGGRRTVTYLELLNILGRRNVMGYTYDASYRERFPVESFFARPVAMLGMEVQFR